MPLDTYASFLLCRAFSGRCRCRRSRPRDERAARAKGFTSTISRMRRRRHDDDARMPHQVGPQAAMPHEIWLFPPPAGARYVDELISSFRFEAA